MTNKDNSLTKSAMIIVIISFVSKIFGFLKEVLFGSTFGTGIDSDTYFLAVSTINLLVLLLIQSINTTIIPILSEIEEKEGKQEKIIHTNNFLNISIFISILLMMLGYVFTSKLVSITAPGFKSYYQINLATKLIRIGLPTILFSTIKGILIGYLQTENQFREGAALTIPLNLLFIIFLIFLSDKFGVIGLMFVSIIGAILQTIMVSNGLKNTDYRYSFILNFKDAYLVKLIKLLPPVFLGVGVSSINSLIDKSMASGLIEGSISSLNYAEKLTLMVDGVLISAITTVLFPKLSKEANKENKVDFFENLIRGMNIILVITIPATIGMLVLSQPIVILAFERGNFDSAATLMTSSALVFISLRLVTTSINSLIIRSYYSLQDTVTPLVISIIGVFVNIIFNVLLVKSMNHNGLALASTISSYISGITLLYLLKRRYKDFKLKKSIKIALISTISSLIMGVIVKVVYSKISYLIAGSKIYLVLNLSISVVVGIIVYSILMYLFKIHKCILTFE